MSWTPLLVTEVVETELVSLTGVDRLGGPVTVPTEPIRRRRNLEKCTYTHLKDNTRFVVESMTHESSRTVSNPLYPGILNRFSYPSINFRTS